MFQSEWFELLTDLTLRGCNMDVLLLKHVPQAGDKDDGLLTGWDVLSIPLDLIDFIMGTYVRLLDHVGYGVLRDWAQIS